MKRDWDAFFMGVALDEFGSRPYLAGTMKNFLDHTNVSTGEVQGCLKPSGATGGIYHAKPVVVQGAWLSCKGNASEMAGFQPFEAQMGALLDYWDRPPRYHDLGGGDGLHVWHDQLQSGADNLVTSRCPSKWSFWCWSEAADANALASADLPMFLSREHTAFANFQRAWARGAASSDEATRRVRLAESYEAASEAILKQMKKWLWSEAAGCFVARDVKRNESVLNRVFLMGMPLWGAIAGASDAAAGAATLLPRCPLCRAARIAANLLAADMYTDWGFRSTSSSDPRYSNRKEITPYSNWRGPIWTNANAILAFGLARYPSLQSHAREVAARLVRALADDLRKTGTWHECMSSASGAGLAAPGFLSWNTLGARLKQDIAAGHDPFTL